ncbi:MAG: AAA family ATPase [Oscillospiraceae bacterium]|jgi:chromosome partitioning protein|nr:AAA family ATPase [Oscillospiraceae bacterium]
MKSCKVISCALAKGGTTKTTSTINIGAALTPLGYSVVAVDNDPQSNLTTALGHDPKSVRYTLASKMLNVLDDSDGPLMKDCLLPCNMLDLLPSNQKLALVEKRLTVKSKSSILAGQDDLPAELVMRKTLEPLREHFDYILIDCPPSAGLLTINAMAASDSVLIPMEAHFLGFEAIKQTLELILRVRAQLNPALDVEGILLTKFQDRTALAATEDMWTVANRIIVDVYSQIAGISTVLAGLMSAVSVIGAKMSNNQHKVDQAWDWLKRIWIAWAIINGIGAFIAYVRPLLSGLNTIT